MIWSTGGCRTLWWSPAVKRNMKQICSSYWRYGWWGRKVISVMSHITQEMEGQCEDMQEDIPDIFSDNCIGRSIIFLYQPTSKIYSDQMSGTYLGPHRTPRVFNGSQHRVLHRHVVRVDLHRGDVPQHHAGDLVCHHQSVTLDSVSVCRDWRLLTGTEIFNLTLFLR